MKYYNFLKEYYAFELFRTIRNTFHNNGVYTEHNTKEKIEIFLS